ncbi:MAG: 30S ribosomal protein S6--L-glutamate ligase [Planctomycetaceae bacterium]|nr:30S ribosomal protein S6--L-glutamate ligase [Planctomycetaceae bacterium]
MQFRVLGNEGSWYCDDLARAAKASGHALERIDFRLLKTTISSDAQRVQSANAILNSCDAMIVRTMPPGSLEQVVYRMDALHALERLGTRVVNSAKSIECAVDKYLTTSKLQLYKLPVPKTFVCESAEDAMEAFDQLGGDILVKPLFGAEGRGIVRVSDLDLALRTFRTLERIDCVLYLQEFINHGGFDIRVLVLNGDVIGSMLRRATDDFRTNVSRTGAAEKHQETQDEVSLALAAAKATGAFFAGVDILYDQTGAPFVIEVNAVPGWRAFNRVHNRDIAAEFIDVLGATI